MTRPRCNVPDVRNLLAIWISIAAVACAGIGAPEATNAPPPGMPTDTAAYNALLAKYPVSRNHHDRKRCAKHWLCLKKVKVRVEPMGTTSMIDPGHAPDTAVPVAHLVNLDDDATESYYTLLPHNQADYVLWVNKKPGSAKAEWRVVGTLTSGELVFGEATDLTYCHKPLNTSGQSDADFANDKIEELGQCNVPEGTTASSTVRGLHFSAVIMGWMEQLAASLLTYSRTGGGWIECANGCCT